jgi:hypothetical protein
MSSLLQQSEEPRYDAETLRRVTRLAQDLQSRGQDTLTAAEIEAAGAEVGLEPRFIQQALAQVSRPRQVPQGDSALRRHWLRTWRRAWWAGGWTLPMLVLMGLPRTDMSAGLWLLSWGVYIAVGVILGSMAKTPSEILAEESGTRGPVISRAEFLEALTALRSAVQVRNTCAALSVEVTGLGPEGKLAIQHPALEALRNWAGDVIRRHGGTVFRAEGLEVEADFPDETEAVRAAHELQTGLPAFNGQYNRGSRSLSLRCAVAGGCLQDGMTAAGLRADADRLRRAADPGDILVNTETAAEAVVELGGIAALPGHSGTDRVFSWRAAQRD